ncbi:hypothetical protein B0H14DRAFT_2603999 [Mycena olivaceomarginata]|nr:hypothetical protein B0H14DRAFT_2603999 [Mycena olivaceomarginata]
MQSTLDLPIPRPLKRSASVASLPTPPRTHHKRKTRRVQTQSRERRRPQCHRRRRRTTYQGGRGRGILLARDESSRRVGHAAPAPLPPSSGPKQKSDSAADAAARRTTRVAAPVASEPPVRAPCTPTPKSSSSTVSPPATPTRASVLRDSPDNPFLASPLGPQDELVVNESSSDALQEEKPTMRFRGVRRSFPNPYYNPSRTSPNPNAQLPPEHPDFEPEERGVRKLLFGVRKSAAGAAAAPKRTGTKTGRRVAQAAVRGRRAAVSASRKTRSDEEAGDVPATAGEGEG